MMFGRTLRRTHSALCLYVFLAIVGYSGLLFGQLEEQAVGLVLQSKDGKLRRAGTELPLSAKAGDILFAGDALLVDSGSIGFLYCPDKTAQILTGTGEVQLEQKQLRVKSGQLSEKKQQTFCSLPRLERESTASQKHLGASLTRDLKPAPPTGTFADRVSALP